MPKIEIYTTPTCPFCVRAKALLRDKNAPFTEIDVARDPDLRAAMTQRSGGRRTVPQIFINEQHIGGCDELMSLDRAGKLDQLLAG